MAALNVWMSNIPDGRRLCWPGGSPIP